MRRVEMAKEKLAHANGGDPRLYLEQLYGLINEEPGGVNYFNGSPEKSHAKHFLVSICVPADCFHERSAVCCRCFSPNSY